MNKKTVVIDLIEAGKTYEGRLLGLVDDKQFHALMTKKAYQNKIFSGGSVSLGEIRKNYGSTGFDGMRLVLAIRRIDGDTVGGKHLFITERLDFIGNENGAEIGILGENDTFYSVSEQ